MRRIRQSESTAAERRVYFTAVSPTNLQTRITGATNSQFFVRTSKNGAATAAKLGTVVQVDATNMPGVYYYEPTAGEVDTLGKLVLVITLDLSGVPPYSMEPREIEIEIVAVDQYDTVRFGLTALPNAAAEAAGGLYTRGAGAGQINQPANGMIDGNTVRWLNSVPAALSSSYVQVSVAAMQTDVVNSNALATTAAQEIRDAIWNATLASYVTAGTTGKKLADIAGDATLANQTTILTNLATLAGYVDTEVAAIKAKTDNLPPDPADASDIAASFAAVIAAIPTATAVRDAILNWAYRPGRTVKGGLRRLFSSFGLATTLKGATVTFYKPDGSPEWTVDQDGAGNRTAVGLGTTESDGV